MSDPEEVIEKILSTLVQGPTIFPIWNCNTLVLLTAYKGLWPRRNLSDKLSVVADDSPGGAITLALANRLNLNRYLIRRRNPADRIRDLQTLISEGPRIVLAVDSHGPYRQVGGATGRLIRSANPSVIPIAAACTRKFLLFNEISMALPLPGGKLVLCLPSETFAFNRKSVKQICANLEDSLNHLDAMAHALLS